MSRSDATFPFSAALLDAYMKTNYRADTPLGPIDIRIGLTQSTLNELLETHNAHSWAFVTAFNPHSVALSASENAFRHRQLCQSVDDAGYLNFPGEGIPDDDRWHSESSLLIIGISKVVAVSLGRSYQQNAILFGEIGGLAMLVNCL